MRQAKNQRVNQPEGRLEIQPYYRLVNFSADILLHRGSPEDRRVNFGGSWAEIMREGTPLRLETS